MNNMRAFRDLVTLGLPTIDTALLIPLPAVDVSGSRYYFISCFFFVNIISVTDEIVISLFIF
jgi:hypothetical protein